MKLTQREQRLVHASASVVWWMEAMGSDLDDLFGSDREALDELRAALAVYVKNEVVRALADRHDQEPEP